jgi:hypothetical protein
MVRLHLVGFTTDLKNLIFATRRGAKSGGYVVSIDPRLKRTLKEVARLEEEGPAEPPPRAGASRSQSRTSQLTPKEIQALLRAGKTVEQVAKLADTDAAWVERFNNPIIAEKAGVIDDVKS